MRVLHIAYQQLRRYGATRVSWAQKLTNGLIRNHHNVLVYSDRDVAAFEAPLGIRDLGKKAANTKLLETAKAYEPDVIIAGHCDMISNATLAQLREQHPDVRIAHCNNDPLFVPSNVARIHSRAEVADAVFVSTGRRELTQFEGSRARVYHMPNPVDPAVENLHNHTAQHLDIDLLFCSNSDEFTERLRNVKWLKDQLGNQLNFKTFGSFGEPPVWGRDYDRVLARTRMGLNFNRQEGDYWYSSARMAQLAGNGILQFTHASARFDELMPDETLVYYQSIEELKDQIQRFNANNELCQSWAANTRAFFHEQMNATLYAQYILEATTLTPFSHPYVWAQDIQLDGQLNEPAQASA